MLSSDAEFFFDGYEGESFAVSGSDGKSTTTTLASLLLSGEGERVPAIGNIGAAMTPWLDRGASRVAIELSSFQLMSACPITTRALITNISPNHLDWHRSFGEYISAKENLLRYATERVFNLDCELSRGIMAHYPADVVFSVRLDEDKIRTEAGSRTAVYLKDGGIFKDGEHLINVCEVANRTAHGINNLVAAIALTHGYVTRERIREVAGAFHGLLHRCEEVGVFDGIRYLNSSIDSTPKRTITTLSSLDGKPIVIIGGRSKGLDYAQLIPHLKSRASLAVLTGETGREVAGLLKDSDLPYRYEPRFDDAVEYAIRHASCGDTVLLSPASTSFDSFSCFEERGNRFKEIIRKFYYKGF